MSRLRTFVAVEIPPDVKVQAARLARRLSECSANVRWVAPENIHLTLKFLGEVDSREVHSVCQKVQQVAQDHTAFQLSCESAGAFPSLEKPRTLWIGVDDSLGQLAKLQQCTEQALADLGFAMDRRKFRGHLTIGRIRYNRRDSEELRGRLERETTTDFGVMPVDELIVYSSSLSRDGPTYTPLGRYPLGS